MVVVVVVVVITLVCPDGGRGRHYLYIAVVVPFVEAVVVTPAAVAVAVAVSSAATGVFVRWRFQYTFWRKSAYDMDMGRTRYLHGSCGSSLRDMDYFRKGIMMIAVGSDNANAIAIANACHIFASVRQH